MPITEFLAHAAFDPDTVALLSSAFDAAWGQIKESDGPLAADGQAASTRELLAKHIIRRAQAGERDKQWLVGDALAHLALLK